MDIKNKYYVGITGMDNSKGYIELTENEAEIVKKVVNSNNWTDVKLNPWSKRFFIIEVKEKL